MEPRVTTAPRPTAVTTASDPVLADPLLLEQLRGRTVVIKFGGNAMVDEELKRTFAEDVVRLRRAGLYPVVVHGGGPQISRMLDRLDLEVRFEAGLRVTTPDVMDVVRMVLTGRVQRELVGLINAHGPLAVGMSGEDAHTMTAVRRAAWVDGEPVDIGLVGDIVDVDADTIRALLERGRIPVVSPVARGSDGQVYNINADLAASALAVALDAEKLLMLTDVEGVYANWPHSTDVIERLTAEGVEKLMPELASGMLPKMEGCLRAVRAGVRKAHVLDGRVPHSVLRGVASADVRGTTVVPDPVEADRERTEPARTGPARTEPARTAPARIDPEVRNA
ncbi:MULTISPECIES: acetylglutamate kinase [unclassified Streptomyces]|uniref:acetylglutamate kinase n=1 Tax=unclassified Streptomyces TaxID=2593676 RepID=UPI0029BFE4E8|nr:acetylglutamate kinase [Streptomyces sp. DK15]